MGSVYWIDRCLDHDTLVDELQEIAEVRRYRETYPDRPGVADAEWIPEITERGWVILTKDSQIQRNPIEREILKRAGARYVCLAVASLSGKNEAACLRRHWATIDSAVRSKRAPLILRVTQSEVRWFEDQEWRVLKNKKPKK